MESNKNNSLLKLINSVNRINRYIDSTGHKLEQRKFKIYPSLAGSVFFIALSAIILILMPHQIKIRQGEAITARTFPAILTFIMIGGSVFNLIKDINRIFQKKKIPFSELSLFTEIKALILLFFLIIYAVLMPLIGFISSSVIYGILMLFYFRIKNWKYYLLVSLLAVIIGFLFKTVLNVRLP